MRWKAWIRGMASLLALTGGCKERVFMTECDLRHYNTLAVANLDVTPDATSHPVIGAVGAPPTVVQPEREIRFVSLQECLAIALEQGTTGNQNPNFVSIFTGSDNLVTFAGRAIATDQIRALALDPAILGASIESSLSKFDAVWTSSMNWQNTDLPTGGLNTGTGFSNTSPLVLTNANFSTGLLKPLATGGVAGITFQTNYQLSNQTAPVNPAYRPNLQFQFEQPLLQGFGVEINQIRPNHPGSILTPNALNTQPTQEGILVTRIRFDQQRAEFSRNLHFLVTNCEQAYWNLYSAYWTLYAREAAMRQAYEAWKISLAKYQAGRVSVADLAQTRGQYELFRGQRITALNQLLETERQLRAIMGMHVEDGTRLVPSDEPSLAPYNPDWDTAWQETMALRPELILAREEVRATQLNLLSTRNSLLPDLRFTSTYNINGIGSQLDGAGADPNTNALRSLAGDHFNSWSVGLTLNMPIGYRNAHANLRIQRLGLARSYQVLRDNELKAERYLGLAYRNLSTNYELIRAQRAQREAFGEQLRARFQEFLAGRGTLDLLLEAQRFWADALANEYTAVGQYNQSIASFHFAKGTILDHDNIVVAEGQLPGCAAVRAVDHEKERTKALVLRERAVPVIHGPFDGEHGVPGLPQLPPDKAPALPSLLESAPPVPPAPGTLETTPAAGPARNSVTPAAEAPKNISLDTAIPATELPKTVPARKKKTDPNKPSDFGALRPDGTPAPMDKAPTGTLSSDPATPAVVRPTAAGLSLPPAPSAAPPPMPGGTLLPPAPGGVLPPVPNR
jgi:outer membrane protein TolC